MPKYPKNKKGKQPLRTSRGLDGRWLARPDPDPPDDQGAQAHLTNMADETPVTAGGLVIREPNPRARIPERATSREASHTTSPQPGALVVRPVSGNSGSGAQRPQSHASPIQADRPTTIENPKPRRPQVTVETVTDEDAGPSK